MTRKSWGGNHARKDRRSPASPQHPDPSVASRPDQLELPVFACVVDESAGLAQEVAEPVRRCSQLRDLPGTSWEDIFGDAA